ncbi:hypothetical protein ACFWOL_32675 [Streptomyces sp. NPDC058442]|uniref:hypothetical protein n=1 Tax=Streptomyces sp. NPDC058442 TaxID=3346503 RepID=UPI00365A482F
MTMVGAVGTVAGFKLADEDPSPSPDGVTVHNIPEQTRDVREYWTKERMRNAKGL